MGIYPEHPFEKFQRFNLRNSSILLLFCVGFSLNITFLCYEAVSLSDYSQSAYACASACALSTVYLIHVLKTEKIFKLIEYFEATIEKSELISSKMSCGSA